MISLGLSGKAQSIVIKTPGFAMNEVELVSCYGDKLIGLKKLITNEDGFGLFHNDTLASGVYFLNFSDSIQLTILYDSDFPGKIILSQNINTGS